MTASCNESVSTRKCEKLWMRRGVTDIERTVISGGAAVYLSICWRLAPFCSLNCRQRLMPTVQSCAFLLVAKRAILRSASFRAPTCKQSQMLEPSSYLEDAKALEGIEANCAQLDFTETVFLVSMPKTTQMMGVPNYALFQGSQDKRVILLL